MYEIPVTDSQSIERFNKMSKRELSLIVIALHTSGIEPGTHGPLV